MPAGLRTAEFVFSTIRTAWAAAQVHDPVVRPRAVILAPDLGREVDISCAMTATTAVQLLDYETCVLVAVEVKTCVSIVDVHLVK